MSRLAIIGTGIAGLGAAHFLHRHHELTIFEAGDHVGGTARSAGSLESDASGATPDDPGFPAYNADASPLLTRLFTRLELPIKDAPVSLSVRDSLGGLEWSGASLNRLFAQRKNLVGFRFLKLLAAIRRFNKDALAAIDDPAVASLTISDYVRARGYGDDLFNLHLLPMCGVLWHASPASMWSFPAGVLLRLLRDQGLLGLRPAGSWRTVDGGARALIDRLIAPFRGSIQLNRRVVRIIRNGPGRGVTVMTAEGAVHAFDRVIVALPADRALRLLINPTPDEDRLLRAFRYQARSVVVHTDSSVLPRSPLARATINYQLRRDAAGRLASSIHRWNNPDHPDAEAANRIVSTDCPPEMIDAAKVIHRDEENRLVFTLDAARAQPELPALNEQARGRTETFFVGGYFGQGLHEDALVSAARLGELLLERDPWETPADASN